MAVHARIVVKRVLRLELELNRKNGAGVNFDGPDHAVSPRVRALSPQACARAVDLH